MTETGIHFDTILHIGAGQGDDVPGWLEAGTQRIVLVEPNPACTPVLTQRAEQPGVTHIEAAITEQDGESLLRVFNLARHSSLRSASGLTDLLPGLRQVALVPVATLSAATLLARLGPLDGTVALIIDAPGSELDILRAFAAADALDQMAAITLICAEEPQYHGAVGRPVLQTLLEQAGFALTTGDTSDPDWPHLTFRVDQQARTITRLTALLDAAQAATLWTQTQADADAAAAQAEIAMLQGLLHASVATQEALTGELDTTTTALHLVQHSLTAAQGDTADALQVATTLRAEFDAALADHKAAAKALNQRITELKTNLIATREALTASEGQTATAQQNAADLYAELDADRVAHQAAVADLTQTITTLRAELDAARTDHDTASHALNQRITELKATLIATREALAASEAQSTAAQQNAADLYAELDADRVAHRAAVADLNQTITALQSETAGLYAELDAARSQALAALAEGEGLTLALATRDRALADHVTAAENQSRLLDAANVTIATRTARVAEVESVLAKLRQAQDAAQAHIADIEAKATEGETTLATARKRISELESVLAQTRATVASRNDEKAAALTQIEDLRQRLLASETAVKSARADAAALAETGAQQAERIKELEFRQILARDELRRAEGQLEVIKDLLLRGDRL